MTSKTRPGSVGPLSPTSRRDMASLQELLRELAFVLLSRGITPRAFSQLSRTAFVQAAAQWSKLQNGRVNYSRIAAQTGLPRAAVRQLLSSEADGDTFSPQHTAVERVINGWVTDPIFQTAGKPKHLAIKGPGTSFRFLTRKYAGDIPPKAVLAELQRVGAVRMHKRQLYLRTAHLLGKGPNLRFISAVVPVLIDGLKLIAQTHGRRSESDPVHRLLLPVHSDTDLAFIRRRCTTSVKSMLEGLNLSLSPQFSASRRTARSERAFAVTVLLSETQPSGRRSLINIHGKGGAHGKATKATPR